MYLFMYLFIYLNGNKDSKLPCDHVISPTITHKAPDFIKKN